MYIPIDMVWIEATMLAMLRFIAFIVIAPPFSHRAFPARVKAMIAIGLALAVSPRVTDGYVPSSSISELLVTMAMELLTGFALGFIVMMIYAAITGAGSLIDVTGGFQIAQAFDPGTQINGAQFARLFQMASVALLISTGAYQVIIAGLAKTFIAVPLGQGIPMGDTANVMVSGVSQMFTASVQIAGPLLIILFLADAGLGLIARVAPALNVFALGFPLKIMLTLALVGVVFGVLPAVIAGLTGDVMKVLTSV